MDDLIAFLNARLDEREHFAKIARLAQKHRDQMLREVEAMRAIVQRYERQSGSGLPGRRTALDILTGVLRDLATIWSDHPAYRPEWKP